MHQSIERARRGQFEYGDGFLEFSLSRLELNLKPEEEIEGAFAVYGPKDRAVEGRVSSTELRMKVMTPYFSGQKDEIGYRFSAAGLVNGDVLKGNFRVISNQGEYLLPYVVTVEAAPIWSSLGDIRNLFHFANLAKTDWNEAMELFYSPDFSRILTGHDARFTGLYRGLCAHRGDGQAMEDFLISIRKKQPVAYFTDVSEIKAYNAAGVSLHAVEITRSGWGYSTLEITVDGDFISVETAAALSAKESPREWRRTAACITERDFEENVCRLSLKIDADALHDGNNYGSVIFRNAYASFQIRVFATRGDEFHKEASLYTRKKRLLVRLISLYEQFRCKRISGETWQSEAGALVQEMRMLDGDDLSFRLYTAHYLITAGRVHEGERVLNRLWERVEEQGEGGDEARCYYLYLLTLCGQTADEAERTAAQMEELFRRNPDSWRIAWIMQFAKNEYTQMPGRKWALLREQFGRGCRSPLLYAETYALLAQYPELLRRLDKFEAYVLEYCAKKELLTAPLIDQAVYMAARSREYDPRLYRLLVACYEVKEGAAGKGTAAAQDRTGREGAGTEALEAICALLIKGSRTDAEAFSWYAKGVARDLRLTRLYEYYMASIGTDEEGRPRERIPKEVLLFFSYQSDLDDRRNAVLYRFLHENRDEYPELYEAYRVRLERFLTEQIAQRHVNRDLGYLYQELLTKSMIEAADAAALLEILYTVEIDVEDDRIAEAVVVYDRCAKERRYPVGGGRAYVPLFGSEYTLLFEDVQGRRLSSGISFETRKLMLPGRLMPLIAPRIGGGQESLELFLCEQERSAFTVTMENVDRYRALEASGELTAHCRRELRANLIRFYYDHDYTKQLTEYLLDAAPEKMDTRERNELLDMMTLTGLNEQALSLLKRYGTYEVDPRVIVRLCGRLDASVTDMADQELAEIVFYAFHKGKYDAASLELLSACFAGTLREMRDIWSAAVTFGADVYGLSERMLARMLYTDSYVGERIDIFRAYVQQGAKEEIEEAFLARSAYDSFVKQKITDSYIFSRIGKLALAGARLPDVCRMAYLRYYAEHTGVERVDERVTKLFLKELLERGVYFPFYLSYLDALPQMRRFSDRTMLEYRTKPGVHCVVHYLSGNADVEGEYLSRQMREMYDGVYVTSFVLFYGEQLQYYVTEGTEEERITESGEIQKSEAGQGGHDGRFQMINDLMIAAQLRDYDTFNRLAEEYESRKFMSERLFRIRKSLDGERPAEGQQI